jgi:hypothetical protein
MRMLHNKLWSSLQMLFQLQERLHELAIAIISIFSSRNQRITILKMDLNSSHYKDYIDHKKFSKWFTQNQDT